MKVSDSREGLVSDKRGVNSSVCLSLQGARMTDHERLEGYKARGLDVTELGTVTSSCHRKYPSYTVYGNMTNYAHVHTQYYHVFLFITISLLTFLTLSTTCLKLIMHCGLLLFILLYVVC